MLDKIEYMGTINATKQLIASLGVQPGDHLLAQRLTLSLSALNSMLLSVNLAGDEGSYFLALNAARLDSAGKQSAPAAMLPASDTAPPSGMRVSTSVRVVEVSASNSTSFVHPPLSSVGRVKRNILGN